MNEEERRKLFVEQVSRVLAPYFSELTDRQRQLLDASLTRLFRKGRDVTDEEILGCHEMITEYVSPRRIEELTSIVRKIYKLDEPQ
jgi:hypothetical protein